MSKGNLTISSQSGRTDHFDRHWSNLSSDSQCPFHFTKEERRAHLEEAEGWNEMHDFFDHVEDILLPDGWTSHETYEQAREILAKLESLEQAET